MSSSGEKKNPSWKSQKAAFTVKLKDKVVFEENINLPSTNFLGTEARGTVLANEVDVVVIHHDDPPPNLQKSTSSTTKVEFHTHKCTFLCDKQ